MYGALAAELVRELKRAAEHLLPYYNEDLIRQVLEEVNAAETRFASVLEQFKDDAKNLEDARVSGSLVALHSSIERNKRCVLAYLQERLERLKRYRWELGAALPEHAKQHASAHETTFFTNYSRLLGDHMSHYDLDLSLTLLPPKEPYITVRVMEDVGEIVTEEGDTLSLVKGTQHLLKQSDVELLIRQGRVEHITT
eukprot:TRINITY_DN8430_c0_g1_i1.p1 TRINITY_DN8430_c0_g1~~TRINITY_DN8430_c0_g1_i1.p1  ORF type:complete len:197 (+),score=40.71 TRINITY_DN8430_c0_g1_i1:79-669(+)